MRPLAALALMATLLWSIAADAETLIVELSSDLVSVTSEFGGASLSLYGIIERDDQTVSRRGQYDIVVVVRGPPEDVLVQERQRRFGIWVNAAGIRFSDMPSYYALITSDGSEDDLRNWLAVAARPHGDGPAPTGRAATYADAIASKRTGDGRYINAIGAVDMLTPRFFRTTIAIPGIAQDGDYTVDVLLFADGVQLDAHRLDFRIQKVGLEQSLFQLSRQRPLVYGLGAVALALVTGYVGGVVFRRN